MKKNLLWGIMVFFAVSVNAQQAEITEGVVSYVTLHNVYVKFQSTKSVLIGDTLFISLDSIFEPAVIVKNRSSISCVCEPITNSPILVGSKLFSNPHLFSIEKRNLPDTVKIDSLGSNYSDSTLTKDKENPTLQKIHGRISVASYSHLSSEGENTQRLRYTLSMNVQNLGGTKISTETYINFAHKAGEWDNVRENIFNGLKIYSLAINYLPNKKHSFWLGRKINPRLSSVGAIDGVQYESTRKPITAGVFAGYRPNLDDYGFNVKLFQFGGYIAHDYVTKWGQLQSSMGIINQMNNGFTDRRFMYFQHTQTFYKKLYFFGSAEFDLFNKTQNTQDSSLNRLHTPKLTNIFILARYKVTEKVSITASYSNRKNIIYYETYKNIIDQLLEASSLKGYSLQVSYHPWNAVSIGLNAGYRTTQHDNTATKNINSYLTFNNIYLINASVTVSSTLMQTSYLKGSIHSLGLSRNLFSDKIYTALYYRSVNYQFANNESKLNQNLAELNVTWRIMKKLSCSVNAETTFEKSRKYQQLYFNITQRF